jgi:hypothetical protein
MVLFSKKNYRSPPISKEEIHFRNPISKTSKRQKNINGTIYVFLREINKINMEQTKRKLYMWRFRQKDTIFALADNLEEAKAIAIGKAGGSLKEDVAEVVNTATPSVTDEAHSFIFETGPQLIG